MKSELDLLAEKIAKLEKSLQMLQSTLVPSGAILAFATDEIPSGWLFCDGRELPRTNYPALFQAIGTTYGFGDGNRTFNIPDLQGLFVRGLDEWGNIDPDRELGEVQKDALQGHRHNDKGHSHEGSTNTAGEHDHEVKERKFNFRNWGGDELYAYCYNGSGKDKAGVLSSGIHSHNLIIKMSKAEISDPISGRFGAVRIDNETRPINVALRYCIKI